jgi:DNA-binding transcriptional MerR regulator
MTIAEVSKKYGLTADTLRYYERIGLLPAWLFNMNIHRYPQ